MEMINPHNRMLRKGLSILKHRNNTRNNNPTFRRVSMVVFTILPVSRGDPLELSGMTIRI